jgi:transcriptional regulator with GAF, ATPase, and Fis domain
MLRSAALLAADRPIEVEHLSEVDSSPALPQKPAPGPPPSTPATSAFRRSLRPPREAIEGALVTSAGNVLRAAHILGTTPRQLYRWLEHFAIEPDQYRR